jgi:hypothetical protein
MAQFSSEIPRYILLEVPVPQQVTASSIEQNITMTSARLRFLLGAQIDERTA